MFQRGQLEELIRLDLTSHQAAAKLGCSDTYIRTRARKWDLRFRNMQDSRGKPKPGQHVQYTPIPEVDIEPGALSEALSRAIERLAPYDRIARDALARQRGEPVEPSLTDRYPIWYDSLRRY